MHPMESHQIATLKASELRRQADLHNRHARELRSAAGQAVPIGSRWSLGRVSAVLSRAVRTA